MESFDSHNKCLISGSWELKPLKKYYKDYLVKSKPVGFVFSRRIPTEAELTDHYNQYGRNEVLSPVTLKRFKELLDEFEKYKKTGRLLDIGCSIGMFLLEARKRGWEVYGTEYTDAAVQICRKNGIEMFQGKLDADWFPENHFDVITSFEVIEHINNPVEEVNNVRKVLRQGGLFYFTTPNFNALERYILGPKYNIIDYPEHLCYYTKHTANFLLTNNGFKRKKLTTTGISVSRIKAGLKHSEQSNGFSVSADEKLRTGMENNKFAGFVKKGVNGLLNFLGLGNALKGWYEKK